MGLFDRFHSEYMPQGESCGWCKNLNISSLSSKFQELLLEEHEFKTI